MFSTEDPPKSLPLSIIILTNRNDARFLSALGSAQFADEVLIIDDHSQLNFNQLKNQYRFKVLKFPGPIVDFSKIRNWGLEHTQHEWVLFLDSDEKLDIASQTKIKSMIEQDQFQGIFAKREDYFLNKKMRWGEVGNFYTLRMGKKPSFKFSRAIHEVAQVEGKISKSNITIRHFAHQSISEFLDQVTTYSRQEAKYRKIQSHKFSLWELLVLPHAKFVSNYFLKLGFLDGWRGLVYALCMSLHSLGIRVNLYEQTQS